jgi:general secretion pathway protein B
MHMRSIDFARSLAGLAVSMSAFAQAPVPQPAAPASAATMGAPAGTPMMPTRPPMNMNPQPAPLARAPAPPAPPTPPVAGLPPDAPKIVINGGIYSEDRKVRAAIVNGTVVREGADLGSGVVLQEIGPAGVVLAFHGNRYNILY